MVKAAEEKRQVREMFIRDRDLSIPPPIETPGCL